MDLKSKVGNLKSGHVALVGGLGMAALYYILNRKKDDDIVAWLKETNPGLSDMEYAALASYWRVYLALNAAQDSEQAANLPDSTADYQDAEADAAAADAQCIATNNPDICATAAAKAQVAANLRQKLIADWTAVLNNYEATYQKAVAELPPVESNYTQAYNSYQELKNYMENRAASTAPQARVYSGKEQSGTIYGVPWGEWGQMKELNIPNDGIRSALVYKGTKITFYQNDWFQGNSRTIDASSGTNWVNNIATWRTSSMKCKPSFGGYQTDLNNRHAIMNTCFTALTNIQTQLGLLREAVFRTQGDLLILGILQTEVAGLLQRVDALITRLYNTYGV